MEKRVVFIIGPARSGTTLLGNLIGSSINVNNLGENRFLWVYLKARLMPRILMPYYKKKILEFYDYKVGNSAIIVDKTPMLSFTSKQLKILFPESKFIFNFRPASDIADSAQYEWFGNITGRGSLDSIEERKLSLFMRIKNKILLKSELPYRLRHPFWWPTLVQDFFILILMLCRFIGTRKQIGFPWGPMNLRIMKVWLTKGTREACYIQADISLDSMMDHLSSYGDGVLCVEYNRVVQEDEYLENRIKNFLELKIETTILKKNKNITSDGYKERYSSFCATSDKRWGRGN